MQASSCRLIKYVGTVTLDKLDSQSRPVNPAIKKAEIKGSKWHQSHDDPNDKKPVISIRFKDENDRRITTGHVHQDGTGKLS
ncbi:hypothetical protein PTNB73_01000 [Pyrenophora teres f. teres]|nr:hypothetical protein HRS9139_02248 [Pyrenophora teres f. teres]KAE8849995.1 hypothetical protein PTNB85_00411 [Pyrenophora teres f. teres]KAE8851981.1 hypothetical protein HRS9122_02268 [Pyrenophora teres f. teres]KAE8870652.1 hypothetical protein PTNB29_00996 [Pyrenophora teres f. teres]KAE8874368.1 hypothetical protein PTNB73_01000 [Pyrenophora teres f. teres]